MIINMKIKGVPRRVHDIYLLYIYLDPYSNASKNYKQMLI